MLSNEEEILIKKLRYCEQEYEQNGYLSVGKFEAIKEAINLIEKQSKEIEELKEKNKELNKYIEDRAKIGKNIQTFINKDYVEQEYVSKDKIKAKIEEVDKDENASIPDFMEYAKEYAKGKLQSLLEKE